MIILNEQVKKVLKIFGIIIGILFLWGIFNLSVGKKSTNNKVPIPMGVGVIDEEGKSWDGGNFNQSLIEPKSVPMIESREMLSNDMVGDTEESLAEEVVDKKVIKNGSLTLKVKETEWTVGEISRIAKAQGGEIFSTNFYERVKGQKNGSMTVKVPVDKFEETIEKIKAVATQVISESTIGQDVTERYADLQAQLKNKRAEEKSFVEILDRAGKIDDVLAVTKQIARVRGEIERLEGKIKYMDSQTDMSTIVVSISEDVEVTPIGDDWRPWQIVKQSCRELVNNMQDFVDGIIKFVIVGIPSLIPFLLFLAIIYWGGKKVYRKIKG